MKRLIITLFILELFQFTYFWYQIDIIKSTVTNNANTANYRARASVNVALDVQRQLDDLRNSSSSAYFTSFEDCTKNRPAVYCLHQ